jgi:hypothetical protein
VTIFGQGNLLNAPGFGGTAAHVETLCIQDVEQHRQNQIGIILGIMVHEDYYVF